MDSMEIQDDTWINRNLTMTSLITQENCQTRKQTSRCATLCLGLLCVLLLAGNIGQIIYYEILTQSVYADPTQANYISSQKDHVQNGNTSLSTERDLLQNNVDALTSERKHLEARLSNVTEEKHTLQQTYNSLATERDEREARFNNLTIEKRRLRVSYDTLKQESDQLQTSYNDLQMTLGGLQRKNDNLTATKDELQTNYSNLQRETNALQARYSAMITTRDQSQSNCSSLKRDKDQLERSFNTVTASKDLLQRSYNSLWKDKDQLQTRLNALRGEKAWLQSNYSSAVASRDHLQKRINKLKTKVKDVSCQAGWTKFDISCYFVSTLKKTWTASQAACRAEGADLVIVDTREEQVFINGLLKLVPSAWIGLTDSDAEGTWRWVDGTPVTTAYWQPGQPNSFSGNQDCGEMVHNSGPGSLGDWNDDACFAEQTWICEQ